MKAASWLKHFSIRKFNKIKEYLIFLGPEKNLVSQGIKDD